ncbi:MAG: IclR family transcriptional regulator, partial [Chloroflexota bacterium]
MKLIENNEHSRYHIDALAKGLEVLSLFTAERPSISFSEMVNILGWNKSSAFRVVSTLQEMGYLQQNPSSGYYLPGVKLLQLGFAAINNLDVRQIAHPFLEELSRKLFETVSLAILNGFNAVFIDRIRNQKIVGVLLGIGSSLPAHCTSLGKVLLADLTVLELNKLLENEILTPFTSNTITKPENLFIELEKIKNQGYAVDDEELSIGLRAAAVPVRDHSGKAIASINVTGTVNSVTVHRLKVEIIPELVQASKNISAQMGFNPVTRN